MTHTSRFTFCLFLICCALPLMAQHSASVDSVVPAIVKFTGTLNDINGKPLTGTVGVSFLLYQEQTGGAPLWIETQNVQADKNGHYSVVLGSTTSHGLPAEAFTGGEARWLAVQPSGQAEQARVVLVSVPYALNARGKRARTGRATSDKTAARRPRDWYDRRPSIVDGEEHHRQVDHHAERHQYQRRRRRERVRWHQHRR
jgi:hypothetical protein